MTTPTPEAIEAAARAMYEDFRLDHNGRYANTPSWDKLGTNEQDHWRRHARVASPFIAAQAKAEALRGLLVMTDSSDEWSFNHEQRAWFRRAIATIEGKSE